jgi:glycosyltransferase involved in cell wall biosynthesis
MSELATTRFPARRALAPAAAPDVEIVVPVYNEAAGLERSIRRLHRFLTDGFPFSWRIVIVDNASVDATPEIAAKLAYTLPRVGHLRLDRKGRGRALRAAWKASDARVVTYMDVDLSTDLRGLLPLVAPLLSGHSDLAIGTRLAHGSRVVRGPKREFISRGYNRILHTVLRARFSDAQCGFKAARRDALENLLDDVKDESWFFDTELLVLAQRRGLRIHEVPVDWVDDPDSRVEIVRTAIADLKGVARLLAGGPMARFLGIGVVSTLAYAVLFLALRPLLGAGGANAAALAITAVANTAANRRLTFGVRGREHLVRHHVRGAVVFVLTLALTNGALAVLHGLDAAPHHALELTVLIAASLTATVTRYVALRTWVFARTGSLQRRHDHARIPATAD